MKKFYPSYAGSLWPRTATLRLHRTLTSVFGIIAAFLLSFSAANSPAALTWHWNATPSDVNASNDIYYAMSTAVAVFNTYSDYNYDIGVIYASGTPTADAGFHGQIRFGGSRSYRVAMHEMCHWLGTGTWGTWNDFRPTSAWIGTHGNNVAQAYDGPGAGIGCDAQHYWPYGWNYDNEAVYPERLIGFVGGFLQDMGTESDKTIGFAPGTYLLRNRNNARLLDNFGSIVDGAQVRQWGDSGNANQQWVLSLIPGTTLFKLRSVATGKYLDTLGNIADGSAVGQAAENFSTGQQWQVVKTDSGYYKLINVANGKCLDTGGQFVEGAGMQQWGNNPSWNQDWKFINTALPGIAAGLVSQFKPATASSSAGGHLPVNGNDGNIPLIRWTANGGAYPQWWRVDLGAMHNITNVVTYWFPGFSFQYRIEVSTNDVNYTTAVDATANAVVGTTTDNFSAAARYVRITATGIVPGGGWASFYDCQIFGTPQTPATPTGLMATPASSQQINLTWADLPGVTGFNIKRSTVNGGPYTTIANDVRGLNYSDAGLSGATTYYYVVSAFSAGGESGNSTQASATTPAPTQPTAPTGLAALPGHNQVVLGWNASAEATAYDVKRATIAGGPFTTIGSATTPTYTDSTAVNGLTYYYVVSGTNTAGESLNSAQVVASPIAMFAHWKFNETTGTAAFDSVATRHGTLWAGAGWTGGKFGNALGLNGAGNYATLPAGVVSSLTGNFSIAAWVYVNANGTWARIFDFGTGTTVFMVITPVSGGNTVRYSIANGGGEQQINGPALSPGAWHHVAMTLSGTTGTLYVNGVVVGNNTGMTLKPSNLGNTTQNYIGRSQFPDPYLNGRVDDLRIYSVALSGAQVAALANSEGVPAIPASFVASPGNNQVGLNWTTVASVSNYKVKRSTVNGGPYTTIATATGANHTDATALNGITYYYVVAAANGAGEGGNSPQAAVTPTDALVHLKFNEASGTVAADSSGNGNTGALFTGASFSALGKINNAVALNGSSGYVSLPQGVVSSLNDFSIATWVFVNVNATWARLFDFGAGTGANMFLAPASGGNTVRYSIKLSGTPEQQINSAAVLSPGVWHHVAVTLSGTTGTLYVDGVAVGTNTGMTSKPSNLGNTALNYIGKSQYADPYLNGRVDDFRIYRRALSAAEVSTLFTSNGSVPAAPTSPAATPGNAQVALSWNASATATSYKVKRATVSGGPYTTITNVTGTACLNVSLVNGTKYFYVVAAANISGEGANSVQVSATPSSTTPVNLAMSASAGVLDLSWPADHTGWRLQVQTNSTSTGLGTNWFDVAGSTATNSVSLPVDANNGSVFYRLTYP